VSHGSADKEQVEWKRRRSVKQARLIKRRQLPEVALRPQPLAERKNIATQDRPYGVLGTDEGKFIE
jgi:hypothetical protein